MNISNKYRIITLFAVVSLLAFSFLPYASAEWTLSGNVLNGATCNVIVGARVSSPYNGNAFNLTNSNGNYTLILGEGAYNVTVNAIGFVPITFNTPYETAGSYRFTTYVLASGAKSVNCTKGVVAVNSTVPTTATLSTVPSTAPTTTVAAAQSNSGSSKGLLEVGAGIIVLIIIIVVAFYAMGGKKTKKEQPKAENKA